MRAFVLLPLLILACQRPPETAGGPPGACPAPTGDTSGWQTIDADAFTFRLPPGFERQDVQAIDSRAETWRRGAAVVSFDMGWYSSDLRDSGGMYDDYQACTENIGGRDAYLITAIINNPADTAQHGRYVAAATWRDIPRPDSRDDTPVHLTIWTETADAAARDEMLRVLRSVRFSGS